MTGDWGLEIRDWGLGSVGRVAKHGDVVNALRGADGAHEGNVGVYAGADGQPGSPGAVVAGSLEDFAGSF